MKFRLQLKTTLLAVLALATMNAIHGQNPPHRSPGIASISVCSPTGTSVQGSCPSGTFDTQQMVLGPGGTSVNDTTNGLGVGVAPDEHSTVFAPGTLGTNQEYLFFLASGSGGHDWIGVSVLSGGLGPDQSGQWTLGFSYIDGYGSYPGGGFGPVFNPSTRGDFCPIVQDHLAADQDQTFDMHYAASGSVVIDPTATPGSLVMVYEGTNACIGNPGGKISGNSDDYLTLAIATSLDYGKNWPTYRGKPGFDFVQMPGVNPTEAPNAPMGALGANVCMGNDCTTTPPASYGRYPVVTPPTSLASLMAGGALSSKFGEQEISGFVDDVGGNPDPYLYINSGDVRVARAQLNGGTAPLSFLKWDGTAFASVGLGGVETSVLPPGAFKNCTAPAQSQFGSSISYVDSTQQYLLTFVCVSPGDPALGVIPGSTRGAAWFYSTSYDLSDQSQWSTPQEIEGSWNIFDTTGQCTDYNGWYPTLVSLDKNPGHLSMTGYVFYLWGCQGGGTPGVNTRQFSSRAFRITRAVAAGQ